MARHTFEYPKGPRNTVNRYNHQAVYDLTTIHSIINSTPVLHVSFTPSDPSDPFPCILPLIGQMGSYDRPSASLGEPLECYLHGYVSSRIMNLARGASSSSSSSTGTGTSTSTSTSTSSKGLPVCIAASKVDGLVLTLTPNSHNYNYRSAILFGYATLVDDLDEKLWAMQLITNSVVPDRWQHSRVPPNAAELAATQILRARIDSGSAKLRAGGPSDERADLADAAVRARVWTGVLPLYERVAEPVPGPYNRVPEVPEHVLAYREVLNRANCEYATEAARRDAPAKKAGAREEEEEE